MKDKLSDLRRHLFETIERLKDDEKPMDVDRAKAISNAAHEILDSAKVELKAIELAGGEVLGSEFLELKQGECERFLPDPRDRTRAFEAASDRKTRGISTGKHLGAA